MHMTINCHRHVWLLSGTGDGPPLVRLLISKGWKVTVSVVSAQAAVPYAHLPLQSLTIGALEGIEAIQKFILKANANHNGFDWIIDATHPFAQVISANLQIACNDLDQPLLRFERICPTIEHACLLKSYKDLSKIDLNGQRLLFAIGSKVLPEAIKVASESGAIVFARVLPTVDGILKALSCDLPQSHLAVLKPLQGDLIGRYESALCRKWGITGILSRQSGGETQKIWQDISKEQGLNLWMISRPCAAKNISTFSNHSELFDHIGSIQ